MTKSLTYSYLGSKRKAVSNKRLDELNSFSSQLTESLEHHRLRSATQKISIFGDRDKDSCKTPHAFCSHLQLFTRLLIFFPFSFLASFFRVINDRGATRTLFFLFLLLFLFSCFVLFFFFHEDFKFSDQAKA